VDKVASGRERALGWRHRTEVTEVTEGDRRRGREGFGWTGWLLGGKRANWGKHRTEATEGDLGWCPENSVGKKPVKEQCRLIFRPEAPVFMEGAPTIKTSIPPVSSVASVRCFPNALPGGGHKRGDRRSGRKALG
jgi:hypothetical protein